MAELMARTWRLVRGLSWSIFPILVALYVSSTSFAGSSFIPWRPLMVDLDVYRRAGQVVLQGGDIYNLPNSLPFIYPPFAALVAVPISLVPGVVAQVGWVIANVIALMAIMYRLGVRGWQLSLITAAVVYFVEPVNQTLAYGQVGIFLVALVVLDIVPGPRLLLGGSSERRLLGEGVLTGLATAIKLTPGLFMIYLLAVGKRRAAVTTVATIAVVTLLAAVILPKESLGFWGRLAHGDTGLGNSVLYYTNQSVMGSWLRIFGMDASTGALAASAAVALLGVWAGLLWHREGKIALAVSLVGVAGLLASPISWSHHFVWVVPLAITIADRAVPTLMRIIGWLFIGWVVAAPFKRLRHGADLELTYNWREHLVDSTTMLFGLMLILASIGLALRQRSGRRAKQLVKAA